MLNGGSAKPLYYRGRMAAGRGRRPAYAAVDFLACRQHEMLPGRLARPLGNSEFELLRTCCAAMGTESRVSGLWRTAGGWSRSGMCFWDWPSSIMSSRWSAIACWSLENCCLPERARDLERRFARNAQRSLRLTQRTAKILACLARRGIEAIPYKGPALAQTVYGDVAMRQFSDLDILIRCVGLRPRCGSGARVGI